jgi:hypothetical protein
VSAKECPTPRKIRHETHESALKQRDDIDRREGQIDKTLKPYHCICGGWHIGHKRGSGRGGLQGKIQRALKGASR